MNRRLRQLAPPLVAAALVTACSEAPPYMEISQAPGSIALDRDPVRDWSGPGGSISIAAPGATTLPQVLTLRVQGRRDDGVSDVNDPLASARLELVGDGACQLTTPLTCMGGICFVELELTGLGLCQARATGVTRDGIAIDACWYRGTWEGDPEDAAFAARMQEDADRAHADCLAR